MEGNVDAYFAQHDVPSVISDLLFELGFHQPKEVGPFIANYIDRKYTLNGQLGGSGYSKNAATSQGLLKDDDFSTIEVHAAPASTTGDDAFACALLEEVRALRKKYHSFQIEKLKSDDPNADVNSFGVIPWTEFKADYGRLLTVFRNQHLWSFCERRLAHLRGLFDAHCALNAGVEEGEVLAQAVPPRVDNCVQLARCLPPNRLMQMFRMKLSETEKVKNRTTVTLTPEEVQEVAPGKKLHDLINELGHPVTPLDLTMDADSPMPSTSELAGVFSRTSNNLRGKYLAEAVTTSFKALEATEEESGGKTFAEYRLPLHPESGAWVDLSQWVAQFNVKSPRAKWVVQLAQGAYTSLKEQRKVLNFGELLDNAFSVPAAALRAQKVSLEEGAPNNDEVGPLPHLLEDIVAFEVAASTGSAEVLTDDCDRDPQDWTGSSSPPYTYQLYHTWARFRALNFFRNDVGKPLYGLRCAANAAEPLACAYLIGANAASRCGALASHAPLQYLFILDAMGAIVSPTSKRSLGGANEAGFKAASQLFRAGVMVALSTEDPTISQRSDCSLSVEYSVTRSMLSLSESDLSELARNSVAISGFEDLKKSSRRESENDDGEEASAKRSIRQRYREGRHAAELDFIAILAPRAVANSGQSGLK